MPLGPEAPVTMTVLPFMLNKSIRESGFGTGIILNAWDLLGKFFSRLAWGEVFREEKRKPVGLCLLSVVALVNGSYEATEAGLGNAKHDAA